MRRRRPQPREVRGWMFWRRAFWTRPAILVLVALAAVVAGGFVVAGAMHELRNESLVRDAVLCDQNPRPCVERLSGQVRGPVDRRREMGTEWAFWQDGRRYDDFHVQSRYDEQLRSGVLGADVEVVDGDVVAVETPAGIVPVWALGARGVARAGVVLVFCVGAVVGCVSYARRKAAACGSWWAVNGPPVDPANRAAALFLFPSSVALIVMQLGVPWWQLWVTVLVLTMAGFAVAFRPRAWPTPRH